MRQVVELVNAGVQPHIFLVPQIATARRYGIDFGHYPHLVAVEAAALATQYAKGALPENQPGAPAR